MDCITCNLEINNENYILCSCGNKYHYKCYIKQKLCKQIGLINHHQICYSVI